MNIESCKNWEKLFQEFLVREGITDQNFLEFIANKNRTKSLPLSYDEFGWAVFPICDDEGVLRDIRMVVPVIIDEMTLRVNIHEYTHAYELYFELGTVYQDKIEERETRAKEAEKRFLLYRDEHKK